ncbi:hypothetical protein PRUPE_6G240600 [Prunus persica]|uniref:Uncharacterized protein n=1 Tax=Prunus persica TaxID=3760 RepID=A0A251NV07_PRUPE|nr:hypothetical protein PRUPE_6G240600 [Prunus persica]
MAINNRESNVQEESNPLLSQQFEEPQKDAEKPAKASPETQSPEKSQAEMGHVNGGGNGCGWTADGLPLGHGSVMGEPMGRAQWDSGLLACLGRNDDFCSSDLEVCLLGSVAPCVLYGSNVERLGSTPGTFANHCLSYYGLYLIGNTFFGWNCLAPWFSYPSRTAIRRKFNLEATVRRFIGHVDAVAALWKMRYNKNSVRPPVILRLMFSAMHAPFVRKVVRSVAGCFILVSMLNQFWL